MSVTDADSVPGETTDTCNALEAHNRIRALLGRPPQTVAEFAEHKVKVTARRQAWELSRTGKTCDKCGRTLTATERAWIYSGAVFVGPFAMRYRKQRVCGDCVPKWRRFGPPQPCEHCKRPVLYQQSYRRRWHAFCCDCCQWLYYDRLARERRAQKRQGMTCTECGTEFVPKRADAKYCSGACRQKAYRRRHNRQA